jgi:hypothetical protein
MHARRFAVMLLGFWLAGSMAITFLVADSAKSAARLQAEHSAAADVRLKALAPEDARLMLAYPVRQQMRWWLDGWENLDLAFAALFFLFLLFGTREGKVVLSYALGIFAIVLFQRFFTTPQILYLSAQMDFVHAGVATPERNQLVAAQSAFTSIEIFKMLAILGLSVYMLARTRRLRHSWNQVDVINESDHRHVDR